MKHFALIKYEVNFRIFKNTKIKSPTGALESIFHYYHKQCAFYLKLRPFAGSRVKNNKLKECNE